MPSVLMPGETLVPEGGQGQSEVVSNNGNYRLVLQSNGNLVFYQADGTKLWAAGTFDQNVTHAVMQPNGNFIVFAADGSKPYTSKTFDRPGAFLVVHDDGFAAILDPNDALWTVPE